MYLHVYFHFAFEVRETTNLFWILFHELLQLSLLQMLNIAFFMHIPLLGPEIRCQKRCSRIVPRIRSFIRPYSEAVQGWHFKCLSWTEKSCPNLLVKMIFRNTCKNWINQEFQRNKPIPQNTVLLQLAKILSRLRPYHLRSSARYSTWVALITHTLGRCM